MRDVFGPGREAVLARELTKVFETVLGEPLAELAARVAADSNQQRGECVLLVAGRGEEVDAKLAEGQRVFAILREELPPAKAAKLAAAISGAPRKALYDAGNGEQGTGERVGRATGSVRVGPGRKACRRTLCFCVADVRFAWFRLRSPSRTDRCRPAPALLLPPSASRIFSARPSRESDLIERFLELDLAFLVQRVQRLVEGLHAFLQAAVHRFLDLVDLAAADACRGCSGVFSSTSTAGRRMVSLPMTRAA